MEGAVENQQPLEFTTSTNELVLEPIAGVDKILEMGKKRGNPDLRNAIVFEDWLCPFPDGFIGADCGGAKKISAMSSRNLDGSMDAVFPMVNGIAFVEVIFLALDCPRGGISSPNVFLTTEVYSIAEARYPITTGDTGTGSCISTGDTS